MCWSCLGGWVELGRGSSRVCGELVGLGDFNGLAFLVWLSSGVPQT